jgi:hypothetical protein
VGVGVYGYFLNTSKGVQRRGRLWRHRGRRHLGKCQCGNRSVSFGPAEAARTQVCLYLCCRYVIGQYVTVHGDVISHVNITRVVVEDGGEYSCTAENRAGKVTHAARLNVYGKERRTRGCFGGMNTSSRASLAGPDGPRPHSFFHNDHNDHNDYYVLQVTGSHPKSFGFSTTIITSSVFAGATSRSQSLHFLKYKLLSNNGDSAFQKIYSNMY